MAATGGDISEVTWNHPTLGSGTLFPKSNEGNTYDVGGIRTGDDANMISGAGTPIYQMNRQRGFFEIVVENDQNVRGDAELMAELAADPVEADWTFSVLNGTTWGGKGKPVGDIAPDINASTFTLKVAGGGFKKISG